MRWAPIGAVKKRNIIMASARVVVETSKKYNAVPANNRPTPNVAALVVTEIRRYKSGIRTSPMAASRIKRVPSEITTIMNNSFIFLSFFKVIGKSDRTQESYEREYHSNIEKRLALIDNAVNSNNTDPYGYKQIQCDNPIRKTGPDEKPDENQNP